MKKLVSILSTAVLTTTASTTVIACCKSRDLTTVIINKSLEDIYVGQLEIPNKTQILKAIKNKNDKADSLTENDFDIKYSNTTETIIIGKGKYKNEIILNYKINNFKKVSGWNSDINKDEIYSLINVNNTIYAGTKTANNKGNLYKFDGTNVTLVNNWNERNGVVHSLVNVNSTIYAGTGIDNGKGNLYKSQNGGNFEKVTSWYETKGTVKYLMNVNDAIYAVAWSTSNEIYISEKF